MRYLTTLLLLLIPTLAGATPPRRLAQAPRPPQAPRLVSARTCGCRNHVECTCPRGACACTICRPHTCCGCAETGKCDCTRGCACAACKETAPAAFAPRMAPMSFRPASAFMPAFGGNFGGGGCSGGG